MFHVYPDIIFVLTLSNPVITSVISLMKTTGAPFSLFFYLVARCFRAPTSLPPRTKGAIAVDDGNDDVHPPSRARVYQNTKPQRDTESTASSYNWLMQLIGASFRALYNCIRSACCSQMGPGTTTVTH